MDLQTLKVGSIDKSNFKTFKVKYWQTLFIKSPQYIFLNPVCRQA